VSLRYTKKTLNKFFFISSIKKKMHTNISDSKLENTEIPQNHNHNYNTDDVTIIIQGVISDNVHVIQLIDEYKNYGKLSYRHIFRIIVI